jgi:hypothetical protein
MRDSVKHMIRLDGWAFSEGTRRKSAPPIAAETVPGRAPAVTGELAPGRCGRCRQIDIDTDGMG